MAGWPRDVAEGLLAEALPRRWAHTQGVARQARSFADRLGADAGLVEAAAWLHDIGCSPTIAVTGFHPLDGARYLRDALKADATLCALVAHHSGAAVEAGFRELASELADFGAPGDHARLLEFVTAADLTTAPDGQLRTSIGAGWTGRLTSRAVSTMGYRVRRLSLRSRL